jgi:hypothetical protein
VAAALTSGYREKPQWENQEFVRVANRHIGISPEKTNERLNNRFPKNLAEEQGVEPTVLTHRSEFLRLLASTSGAPPLNGHGSRIRTGVSEVKARRPGPLDDAAIYGAGGESALQTFTPHLHFKNLSLLFFPWKSLYWRSNGHGPSRQMFLRNCERKHVLTRTPFHREGTSFGPVVINKIEKCYSGEACTTSALRSISLERIRPGVLSPHRLNTNRMGGLVPEQKYEGFLIFSKHFRATIINRDASVVGNRDFRRGSPYKISSENLKRHRLKSFLRWPKSQIPLAKIDGRAPCYVPMEMYH